MKLLQMTRSHLPKNLFAYMVLSGIMKSAINKDFLMILTSQSKKLVTLPEK